MAPAPLGIIPGAPLMRDMGVDLTSGLWKAIYAPARTPPAILDRLNQAVREAMAAPAFVEVVRQQGAVPEPTTPEAPARFYTTIGCGSDGRSASAKARARMSVPPPAA